MENITIERDRPTQFIVYVKTLNPATGKYIDANIPLAHLFATKLAFSQRASMVDLYNGEFLYCGQINLYNVSRITEYDFTASPAKESQVWPFAPATEERAAS